MERRSIERILAPLDAAPARYLIAGGLAVVAHGLVRFTADLDLILDPEPRATARAISALESLGYVPRAPVPFAGLADPETRRCWVRDEGLTVFTVASPEHPATEVDLFVECPLDFERAHTDALRPELRPGLAATFVSRGDLLALERAAGRPRDLEDIAGLEALARPEGGDDVR
jgi:hypothetical protein